MHDVLTVILAGAQGFQLHPLTQRRSKPAIPIAGKYRLIDIPISNCLNSGFNRTFVVTQYQSVSLHRHITNTYKFGPFTRGFVEVLHAQVTNEKADWYRGTADEVRRNLQHFEQEPGRYFLILSGDALYRMDYRDLLQTHCNSGADLTLALAPVQAESTAQLGIAQVDETGRLAAFFERPQASQLDALRPPADWMKRQGAAAEGEFLASMGIYLFNRDVLFNLLTQMDQVNDLGGEMMPAAVKTLHVQGHLFRGYWNTLETIGAFHSSNLALAGEQTPFAFHSPEGIIYTRMRNLPASRLSGCQARASLISDGCIIGADTKMERCVVGVRSLIGSKATLRDAVLFGANFYESAEEQAEHRARGEPDMGIGDGSLLERVILDKNCRIGRDVRIMNRRGLRQADGDRYVIRDGIVVIPHAAVIPDGTEI